VADPLSLSRLLMYGNAATRRSVADGLLESGSADDWAMLAATARSNEPWLLRARCLEVLGMAAAGGDEPTAQAILALVLNAEAPSTAGGR
jgi:hypothetical protein